MKEIISYQAFDGTIFESEVECKEYESDYSLYERKLNEYVSLYDEEGRLINIPDPCEVLDFLKNYDGYFFIHIKHDEMPDTWEEAAIDGFPYRKGLYRWDNRQYKWISLSEDIRAAKSWEPLVKYAKTITYSIRIEDCLV